MRGSVGELYMHFGMIELNVPLEKLLSPQHSNQIWQTLNTDIIKGKSDVKNLQETARVLARSRAQTVQIDQ